MYRENKRQGKKSKKEIGMGAVKIKFLLGIINQGTYYRNYYTVLFSFIALN